MRPLACPQVGVLTTHLHASRQLNARQAEKVKCLEERLSQASEEQLSTNQIVIQLSTERDQLTAQVRSRCGADALRTAHPALPTSHALC